MSLYLGLDIGVSSVGYGVVNEDGEPIAAGVRLFSQCEKENNASRRAFRHQRRTLRRRKHRLLRADELFVSVGLAEYDTNKKIDLKCDGNITPYHLRVKGLSEQLTNKELIIALRHLLKRRGSMPLNAYEENDDKSEKVSTKEIIASTKKLLEEGRYVCEIQLDRLLSSFDSRVRGIENRFLAEDYLKEAKKILETQKQFNPLVTEDFCVAYIKLLDTRRKYYVGPGKGSPYGWKNTEEWMERLIGKCVYTGERRIVKLAPSAEVFNLLNDLNNMIVDGEHLTYDEKVLLFEEVFKKIKSSPKVSTVKKALNKPANANVTGLRVDTKGNELFSTLSGWHYINDANELTGNTLDMNDFVLLDKIAETLTIYQSEEDAKVKLGELGLQNALIAELVKVYDKKTKFFKGSHRLSRTAIWKILPDMWCSPKNQMQLFAEKNIKPIHGSQYVKNGRVIPAIVNNMSVSSVARRAISQAFTVYNDLMDKYPKGFVKITVEMARMGNLSNEEKARIREIQKFNQEVNNEVKEIIGNYTGSDLFEKIKLLYLQNQKDVYTGETILFEDVINSPGEYEIDHIIPLSISFDDSFNNKVLTRLENNQNKGQKTPYQWMSEADFAKLTQIINSSADRNLLPQKKRNNLLCKEDVNKWSVKSKFINRNLVDTSYACREVVFALKECLKDKGTTVGTINGRFTNYLRKEWRLKKDRDVDFSHHAVDALIVAVSPLVTTQLDVVRRYDTLSNDSFDDDVLLDRKTGEVICAASDAQNLKNAIDQFHSIGTQFSRFKNIKYSHKIDKKENRKLYDATLYSTRIRPSDGEEYKIEKINLYENYKDASKLKKIAKFFETNPEELLMYETDKDSYLKLKKVYDEYIDRASGNPFYLYSREHPDQPYITKYSIKDKGPAIKSLKYYSGKMSGNPIDLTSKYNCKPGKRVIADGQTTYRIDVYKSCKKGYKIIRVSAAMVGDSVVNKTLYEKEKVKQNITDDDKFLFSLYENDIIELDGELYRYRGYSSRNDIYVQYINRNNYSENKKMKSLSKTIGMHTNLIKKLYCDSIGMSC